MSKKRWCMVAALFVAIALGLIFYFDRQIVIFFESLRNVYLNQLFLAVKFIDNEIFVVIFLTLLFLLTRKKCGWILPLWMTLGATAIASFLLKILVHRARPFATGVVSLAQGVIANPSYLVWDFSFPSFDAAFAFCAIPILSKFYPKLKYIWIAFATLVLLSRVYFGVHYLSDAISGALIGLLMGMLIVKLEEKKKFGEKIYRKIFKK